MSQNVCSLRIPSSQGQCSKRVYHHWSGLRILKAPADLVQLLVARLGILTASAERGHLHLKETTADRFAGQGAYRGIL